MADTLVSVRGRALLDVPPDFVTLTTSVTAVAKTRKEALDAANRKSHNLTAKLEELGANPAAAERPTDAFAYVRDSVSTTVETVWDEKQRKHTKTGNIQTRVQVRLTLRNFELLDPVLNAVAYENAALGGVYWAVDPENPNWREVRRDAVQAAITQARDYATALGGTLAGIEHLADTGLLGSDGGRGAPDTAFAAAPMGAMSRSSGGADTPLATELTPVPQRLRAGVEARFLVADIDPLNPPG